MRLIKIEVRPASVHKNSALLLSFEEFYSDFPPYAILSHTWGPEEVAFAAFFDKSSKEKYGYRKVVQASRQALRDGFEYLWVDTCCIDKRSSAELSEAINSMYDWYRRSQLCYAFLSDVAQKDLPSPLTIDTFPFTHERGVSGKTRWLTRGWTLQELLGSRQVQFFDKNWVSLGFKREPDAYRPTELCIATSLSTGIPREVLTGAKGPHKYCVAEKMSWAAFRETARVEDRAYALLGLFGVTMPLLYGEGPKAFFRLQQEIVKVSDDQTLFAWGPRCDEEHLLSSHGPRVGSLSFPRSLLANSPDAFCDSGSIRPISSLHNAITPSFTNDGLSISLPVLKRSTYNHCIAILACIDIHHENQHVGILLDMGQQFTGPKDDIRTLHNVCSLAPSVSWPQLWIPPASLASATVCKIFIRHGFSPGTDYRPRHADIGLKPSDYRFIRLDWNALGLKGYLLRDVVGLFDDRMKGFTEGLHIDLIDRYLSVIDISPRSGSGKLHYTQLAFHRESDAVQPTLKLPGEVLVVLLQEHGGSWATTVYLALSVAARDSEKESGPTLSRMDAGGTRLGDSAVATLQGLQYEMKAPATLLRLHDQRYLRVALTVRPVLA